MTGEKEELDKEIDELEADGSVFCPDCKKDTPYKEEYSLDGEIGGRCLKCKNLLQLRELTDDEANQLIEQAKKGVSTK